MLSRVQRKRLKGAVSLVWSWAWTREFWGILRLQRWGIGAFTISEMRLMGWRVGSSLDLVKAGHEEKTLPCRFFHLD